MQRFPFNSFSEFCFSLKETNWYVKHYLNESTYLRLKFSSSAGVICWWWPEPFAAANQYDAIRGKVIETVFVYGLLVYIGIIKISGYFKFLYFFFQDSQKLNPSTDFYKKLALDCAGDQIAIDLFVLAGQHVDLSSLCKYRPFIMIVPSHWSIAFGEGFLVRLKGVR